MDLAALAETLIAWIVAIGQRVDDLPGLVAFSLGLATWFTVEQVLRRVMSGLRWVVLIGVLAGLGVSAPYVLGLMFERGGAVQIEGAQAVQ